MKKLFLILCVIAFIGCTNTPNEAIEKAIYVPSKQIYVSGTLYYFYQFEYEGHQYITPYHCDILLHSPSCPCHNNSSSLNNSYLFN